MAENNPGPEIPKEKIEKIANALDLPRIKEDISMLREDVQQVSQNLNALVQALQNHSQSQPSQQNQPQNLGDDVSPEQKMLLIKDGIAGLADLVKAWKGNTMPPQMQQQNDFQTMIMQSFAKMIQAKVDETIFSTYGTQIPANQIELVRQIQNSISSVNPNPSKVGFEK